MNSGPDVFGIISIVAAVLAIVLHLVACCGGMIIPFLTMVLLPIMWVLVLVGLVLGAIGFFTGRNNGRSTVLSIIGAILNLLLVLEQVALVVLGFVMGGLAAVLMLFGIAAGA